MDSKKDPPFLKSIQHLQELFEISFQSGLESVQLTYANFKSRNQKLIERQNDQSNTAQVQLISHFATLATLTVTVLGLLTALTDNNLTNNEQFLILFIVILEICSLCFGAADYIQTILFHRKWAMVYQNIDKEVDSKFETSELQWTNDLNRIESEHLSKAHESTKMWITYWMVGLCLTGLLLLVPLFCAIFYDIPMIK